MRRRHCFVAKKGIATTDYAVGTKVLVTISSEEELRTDEPMAVRHDAEYWMLKVAYAIAAAESKTGKLTGASDLAYAESVSIDGTKYPAELAALSWAKTRP